MNNNRVAFSSVFLYYKENSATNAGTDVRLQQVAVPLIVLFVSHSLGCDDTINPSAAFVPRMAVYSVLTTQSDTQFVRIYASYNPAENNPQNNLDELPVTDANVTITDGSTTYTFRDTTIARPDTSRYKSPLHIYYCYPMAVEADKQYSLQVNSTAYGTASANVSIPQQGQMQPPSGQFLNDPIRFRRLPLNVEYEPTPQAKAFLIRLYVVFTAENFWEPESVRGKEKYFEIPIRRIATNRLAEECIIQYPQIRKLGTIRAPTQGQQPLLLAFPFPFLTYVESIARISRSNFNARFKRAVSYYVQFDDPWYKYYATTNLFEDKLGVRLDNPLYSNMNGSIGLFGSMRVDSVIVPLQETIPYLFEMSGDAFYVYCQQEAPPSTEPLQELQKLMFRGN